MNVLSLFDGMGCLGIALKDLGVEFNYYTSEIDKHAIKQSKLNFPESTQLGDVTKWKEWKINWASINLIGAGSPCQGFSFAGKQLAFDDPRSALFFTFVEILEHCRKHNPNVKFLLENVKMKKEHELVISQYMGVAPIEINSALVSAQNRVRLYWTNIANEPYGLFGDMACKIPQPKDKGILLRDILENEVDEKYYLSEKMKAWLTKHSEKRGSEFKKLDGNQKASCLTTTEAKQNLSNDYIVHNMMPRSSKTGKGGTGHLTRSDGKTYCLDTGNTNAIEINYRIRRLTPTECARLQTIPTWFKWECSDTQQYRMLGNGWTVDVIKHILSYL
jgi:DNA (cytosine-5)-methyltransferase 3A